jgi:hypothetical protein
MSLNFVEVMALYRAFSVGRFRCSGVSPKISITDFLSEGYVLKVAKKSVRKYCLDCIRDFSINEGLRLSEDESYLSIHSPPDKLENFEKNPI